MCSYSGNADSLFAVWEMLTCSPLMANAIRQMLTCKAVPLVPKRKKKKKALDPEYLSLSFIPILPLLIYYLLVQWKLVSLHREGTSRSCKTHPSYLTSMFVINYFKKNSFPWRSIWCRIPKSWALHCKPMFLNFGKVMFVYWIKTYRWFIYKQSYKKVISRWGLNFWQIKLYGQQDFA